MKRVAEITAKAKKEFEDRYYWVEGENGDAQVEVTDLAPDDEPTRSLPEDRSGWLPPPAPCACESLRPYLFPLLAFIKKKGTGTEPMPFVALWLP